MKYNLNGVHSFFRRNNVTIGIVVIILAFGSILFMLASASSHIEQQQQTDAIILNQLNGTAKHLNGITSSLDANSKQSTQQITTLTNRLNCIVLFFSGTNPDRANKAIDDINTCTITSTTSSVTTKLPVSSGTPSSTVTPPMGSTSSHVVTPSTLSGTNASSAPTAPIQAETPPSQSSSFISQALQSADNIINKVL